MSAEHEDEMETGDEGTDSNEVDDNDCERNNGEDVFESMEAESDEEGKVEDTDQEEIAANPDLNNLVRNGVTNNDNEVNMGLTSHNI